MQKYHQLEIGVIFMENHLVIRLDSVKTGKNAYWLVFEGFIPQYSVNKLYTFEFCGTELITNSGLPDDLKEQLLKQLQAKFGTPPYGGYDLRMVRKKFKNEACSRYELKYLH
jgi:hypothetical protein